MASAPSCFPRSSSSILGYPILPAAALPKELAGVARQAAVACPTLALRVERATAARR
jgi:ferredoxin